MRRRQGKKRRPDLRYDLNEFRVWMGPLVYKLNDIQLRERQRQMNELAKILIELWEFKSDYEVQMIRNRLTPLRVS